jgi:hypothetical protein
MKLTQDQLNQLHSVWCKAPSDVFQSFSLLCDAYLAMMQASKTHRVVEAPDGYEFHGEGKLCSQSGVAYMTTYFQPIPKPCPAPVLDPVTVTVEDIYPAGYKIHNGYEARFDRVDDLKRLDFPQYIPTCFTGPAGSVWRWDQGDCMGHDYRIGLRKWEGK